ncbi:unnamed protein product [Symbiodinium sp. CCMP2456]|nr:unnamed protein product [Symbiodinium sp. CCMP2456]
MMRATGVMPTSTGFPNTGQPAFRVMRPQTAGNNVQEARTNMTQLYNQMSPAQQEDFPLPPLPNMPDGASTPPASTYPRDARPRSPRVSRPLTPTGCRTPTAPAPPGAPPGMPGHVPMGMPPAMPPTETVPGARTPRNGARTPVNGFSEAHRNSVAIQPGTPCRVVTPRGGATPTTGAGPGTAPLGSVPTMGGLMGPGPMGPMGSMNPGPCTATTPARYASGATPRGGTTPRGNLTPRGGNLTPRGRPGSATPRRAGGVTPPISSVQRYNEYGQAEDDGFIVNGSWAQPQPQQPGHFQAPMAAPPDAFFVPEPPTPLGPSALPWLPSRRPENADFKMLEKKEFLSKLDEVCDAFQPDEVPITGLSPMSETPISPQNTFKMAVAQSSLSTLLEEAMWSGPIRHMAICVMARRVIMLADAIRNNTETPGGKDLMVALLTSVKQMCAANTNDVSVSKTAKFSGRVILLLGSASCMPEQLIKQCGERYRQIDQNCMILALSMGAEPAGSAQLGKAMALAVNAWGEAEEKYGPPGTAGGAGRPELLVHLFGSAGFHAWAKTLRIWYEQSYYPDQRRLQGRVPTMDRVLRGVILDSAPGDSGNKMLGAFPLVQGDAALLSAMNGYGADGTELSEVAKLQASQSSMRELTKRNGPLWEYYEDLMRQEQGLQMMVHQHEPGVPLCFIYSSSDRIAPAVQIERYIDECRMRLDQLESQAPEPRQLCFEHSGHVAHRSGATEEEYWRTVHDFWRQALFC